MGKTPLLQGIFYVFHKGNVCSSVRNHMFLLLKTYGSGSGDVKNKTGISRKTGLRFSNSFPNFEMPFLFRIFKNQIVPNNQIRMKKVMLLILLCGVMLTLKATGQSGDVIRLEGEEWVLMAKPIGYDSLLCMRMDDFLPENVSRSTGNYSGYTAFWEVRDGYLCLKRVEADVYDEVSKEESIRVYEVKDLQPIFAAYCRAGTIQARWFSGELRAGKGDVVRYVHDGFDRNMETEQVLTVRNGKVMETQTYHNYRRAGLNLMKAQGEIVRRFPWNRFSEYQGERIIFSISDFQMTEDGHFVDCDVRLIYLRSSREMINDGNHPLALALKETLKSIYPWEVLFINGKYTGEYRNFVMSLQEKTRPDEGDSARNVRKESFN